MSERGFLGRLGGAARPDARTSILANLALILNSRGDAAQSAEDFGVIDLIDIVHDFPLAGDQLQRSIRDTLARYEPRLRNLTVRLVPSGDPLRLSFEITARYSDRGETGTLRLRTELDSSGWASVY